MKYYYVVYTQQTQHSCPNSETLVKGSVLKWLIKTRAEFLETKITINVIHEITASEYKAFAPIVE